MIQEARERERSSRATSADDLERKRQFPERKHPCTSPGRYAPLVLGAAEEVSAAASQASGEVAARSGVVAARSDVVAVAIGEPVAEASAVLGDPHPSVTAALQQQQQPMVVEGEVVQTVHLAYGSASPASHHGTCPAAVVGACPHVVL